jgi:hypothetical protein
LKEKLYRKLGKAETQVVGRNHQSKVAFARELRLPVVNGKVAFLYCYSTKAEISNRQGRVYSDFPTKVDIDFVFILG